MRPSLLTLARRAFATEIALPPAATLLVAVSGGPDSMALLHVLARLAPELALTIVAHGVDHGLRPEAAAELDRAATFAEGLGVRFERTCLSVEAGGNLQARAREARFRALDVAATASGASAVATAHHADDRAETFLIRLLRGAGKTGLAVLPALHEDGRRKLVRPFLRARRDDIVRHVDRHRIPYATDPSNADPRYLRTRVRAEVLPLLATLDPQIVDHIGALADELGETKAEASDLPRATREALAKLEADPRSTARIWLPGGLVVSRDPRAKPKLPPKTTGAGTRGPRVAKPRASS